MHKDTLIDKMMLVLRQIACSYSEKELSQKTVQYIFEFKSIFEQVNHEKVKYDFELNNLSEQCGWDFQDFIEQVISYPNVIPRIRRLNGELHYQFKNFSVSPSSKENSVIQAFFEEVRANFFSKELYKEWVEFESLFNRGLYLAAHAFANKQAQNNDFIIDKNVDEAFWEAIW